METLFYIILFLFIVIVRNFVRKLENVEESLDPKVWQKRQKTIDELIEEKNVSLTLFSELPSRQAPVNELYSFTYKKILCYPIIRVSGRLSTFDICNSSITEIPKRIAYFISGDRDILFEQRFINKTNEKLKLKVFTKEKNGIRAHSALNSSADVVFIKNVVSFSDFNQPLGIKDLIDVNDDYHQLELIKYEMKEKVDSLIFSINIPISAAQILVKLKNFSFEELRYLVKRLIYSMYYPYAINLDSKKSTYFVSFMHRYSFHKYNITKPFDVIWNKN
uniref:Uncharacterized protein n=1 Tax=Ditylenchus dipsaci TaxID=166011 RepID=A0A915DL18_9BILA